MAEKTGIAWTDSTFNPWIGCTKVGPGCDHCYAEALDKRHQWGGATHWGAGVQRKRTGEAYWRQPLAWNRKAAASGKPWRVFCASLADVFDNEVPPEWRWALWDLIAETPALTWLLLTKRIGNARTMLPVLDGQRRAPANVWLGATIVNQEEADRDIPKLLGTPADIRFVSYEPALGPIDWRDPPNDMGEPRFSHLERVDGEGPRIDWIIVGGESTQGAKAREFSIEWARSTVRACRAAGIAPFVKQLGSNIAPVSEADKTGLRLCHKTGNATPIIALKDRAGAEPAEWPIDLRVQEFPNASR